MTNENPSLARAIARRAARVIAAATLAAAALATATGARAQAAAHPAHVHALPPGPSAASTTIPCPSSRCPER